MKDKVIDGMNSCGVCHPETISAGWCVKCIDNPDIFKYTLNPIQVEVLKLTEHDYDPSFVVATKTGTGKTLCAYIAMRKHFEEHSDAKVIWTSPLKQIAREKIAELPEMFPDKSLLELTGDTIDDIGTGVKRNIAISNADIIVTSQEMLDSLSRRPEIYTAINDITMIVADEIHGLGDPNRGGKFDGALTRYLLRMQRLNRVPQIVALSATFDNIDNLKTYFEQFVPKFIVVTSQFSPIKSNIDNEIHTYRQSNKDVIMNEVSKYMDKPGGILVLQLSIPGSKKICNLINDEYGEHTATTNFSEMSKIDKIESIEQFNRGEFKVLCATPTVLAGVNIACTTIILDVSYFNAEKMEKDVLPSSSIRQAAGRVGRPPNYNEGWVSYIADEKLLDKVKERLAAPNTIAGAMVSSIHTVLNIEVALKQTSISELSEWFAHSYSGFSGGLANQTSIFDSTIEYLIDKGYITRSGSCSDDVLRTTRKGKLVATNFIDPVFFEHVVRVLSSTEITSTELLISTMGNLFTHPKSPISWTKGKIEHIEKCFNMQWMIDKEHSYKYNFGIIQGKINWAENAMFMNTKILKVSEQLGLGPVTNNMEIIYNCLSYGIVPMPLISIGKKLEAIGIKFNNKLLLYLYANGVRLADKGVITGPTDWRTPTSAYFDMPSDTYDSIVFAEHQNTFTQIEESIMKYYNKESDETSDWMDELSEE